MNKRIIIVTILILSLTFTGITLVVWQQETSKKAGQQASNSATTTSTPTPGAGEENKPSASETPQPVEQSVQLFLVSLEDTGNTSAKFGCGDAVVGVNKQLTTSTPLANSIRALLAIKDQYYGQSGLYNALWQSNLSLASATISNGVATIALTGELKLGGTCDSPRVEEQLTATATQFDTVTSANITLNGQPLQQALSTQ